MALINLKRFLGLPVGGRQVYQSQGLMGRGGVWKTTVWQVFQFLLQSTVWGTMTLLHDCLE